MSFNNGPGPCRGRSSGPLHRLPEPVRRERRGGAAAAREWRPAPKQTASAGGAAAESGPRSVRRAANLVTGPRLRYPPPGRQARQYSPPSRRRCLARSQQVGRPGRYPAARWSSGSATQCSLAKRPRPLALLRHSWPPPLLASAVQGPLLQGASSPAPKMRMPFLRTRLREGPWMRAPLIRRL